MCTVHQYFSIANMLFREIKLLDQIQFISVFVSMDICIYFSEDHVVRSDVQVFQP